MCGFGLVPVVDGGYKAVTLILKMAAGLKNLVPGSFVARLIIQKNRCVIATHADSASEGIDT
jgi:hypothetical protein